MNAIQNFAFEEHLVRVVQQEGEPWFVGKDVCAALDVRNHNDALSSLDEDEKGVATADPLVPSERGGGAQSVVIVSEAGAFRLVFRSRKPEAERFKRWLAHEVLPQIRKTGEYAMQPRRDPTRESMDITRDAPLAARVDAVRVARSLFGRERAAMLWNDLGLPAVPDVDEFGYKGAAHDLLDRLLSHRIEGKSVRALLLLAMDGDEAARVALMTFGIKPSDEREGFWLGHTAAEVRNVLSVGGYIDGSWRVVMRRLPGVVAGERQSFFGLQSRTTWFPLSVLDEHVGRGV